MSLYLGSEKSRGSKSLTIGLSQLIIRTSKSNLFLTILSPIGLVINNISCGKVGFHGPRKTTNLAAETAGRFLLSILMKKNIRLMHILFKTRYSRLVRKALKAFKRSRPRYFKIWRLSDKIPKPHNGIRKSKLRRI